MKHLGSRSTWRKLQPLLHIETNHPWDFWGCSGGGSSEGWKNERGAEQPVLSSTTPHPPQGCWAALTWPPNLECLHSGFWGEEAKGEEEENVRRFLPTYPEQPIQLFCPTTTHNNRDQLHMSLQDPAWVLLLVLQTQDSLSDLQFCQIGLSKGSQQPMPACNLGRRKTEII